MNAKYLFLIPGLALLALAGYFSSFLGDSTDPVLGADQMALMRRIEVLESQLLAKKKEPQRKSFRRLATEKAPISPSINPESNRPEVAKEAPSAEANSSVQAKEAEIFLERLSDPNVTIDDKQAFWRQVAKGGQAKLVISAMEELAKLNPNDPDVACDLGSAYVAALRSDEVLPTEKRALSKKAMAAFDRSLSINDTHWEARFSQSMMQVFAPPVLGMGPAGRKNFEILIDQQASRVQKPEHAHTYFFLSNLEDSAGNKEKAGQLREEARALFPDDKRFQ